ncbi:polymer-forming cytoskeletal family protein [Oceanispirochaeta crateris]|uniref:Polymer-forming cytoskeletal family protein n=1 Tax=Oceanispirochaeta crateris TaxID=2518645 RepID=A0A5C1QI39_9SPIO|nr:polymer-forming cytoskeletal protein [Oceanispirochaeta crateris]QEN06660.1 polymer-forming cytoskeletal family protein [Oceanispirochaeta crateris]
MSDYIKNHSFINSIIGEGTKFNGELVLNGLLRIDGDFSGSINTSGKVLIGKTGRAECNIIAGTAVVGGVVHGNIFSSGKVVILATGMVVGNIQAKKLVVEEGVLLHGSCVIKGESESSEDTPTPAVGSSYSVDWQSDSKDTGVSGESR